MRFCIVLIAVLIAACTAQINGACGYSQLPVGFLGYGVNPVLLNGPEAYTQPIVQLSYDNPDNKWSYRENNSLSCYPDQAYPPMDLDDNLADLSLSLVESYEYYSKNVSEGLHLSVNFNVPKTNLSVGGQFGYLHQTYKVFTRNEVDFFSQFIRFIEYYMVGLSSKAKPSVDLLMTLDNLPVKSSAEACVADKQCAQQYCRVLQQYGTFYVSRVVMGGSVNVTASFNKTYETHYGASKTEIQASLAIKYLGQSVGMISGSKNTTWAKIDNTFKEGMHNFTGVLGGNQATYAQQGYPQWLATLPLEPEMIIWKSELTPIYELIELSSDDNEMRYDTLRHASLVYFNSGGVAPCNF